MAIRVLLHLTALSGVSSLERCETPGPTQFGGSLLQTQGSQQRAPSKASRAELPAVEEPTAVPQALGQQQLQLTRTGGRLQRGRKLSAALARGPQQGAARVKFTAKSNFTIERKGRWVAGRPELYKALRCTHLEDMSSCEECTALQDCFRHDVAVGDFVVDAVDRRFVRYLLVLHLSLPDAPLIHYRVHSLRKGRLRALWDWKYDFVPGADFPDEVIDVFGKAVTPIEAKGKWSSVPKHDRVFGMQFRLYSGGGHELVFEFVPNDKTGSNRSETMRPRMRLRWLWAEYQSSMLSCLDTDMCLQELAQTDEGKSLRQSNVGLLNCIEDGFRGVVVSSANESAACFSWLRCLTKTSNLIGHPDRGRGRMMAHRLRLLLRAMGVKREASFSKDQRSAIHFLSKDTGRCLYPSHADPLQWNCDCGAEIFAHVNAHLHHRKRTIRHFLCDREEVCQSWKTWACRKARRARRSSMIAEAEELGEAANGSSLVFDSLMKRRSAKRQLSDTDSVEQAGVAKKCQ